MAVRRARARAPRVLTTVLALATLAASVVVTTTLAPPASAAGCTKTWAGTGSSARWNVAANWIPAGVPGVGDSACGGTTFTDIVVDTDVTIQSWSISSRIIDITITSDATMTLTSTSIPSSFHAIVGDSGRLRANNATTTDIGSLQVVADHDFIISGPSAVTVHGGFVAGTLRVGTGRAFPVSDGNVTVDLDTRIPGTVVVNGPVSSLLTLTGADSVGLDYGTTGRITNGPKGHTVLADGSTLRVQSGQRLTITGSFTVESSLIGGTIDTAAGGVLSLDAGFTNLAGGVLTRGVYRLGGTIELPTPLGRSANGTVLQYRGGNFTSAGAVTTPSVNDGQLVIEASTTFAALAGRGNLEVGTKPNAGPATPVTFAVAGAGLQTRGNVTVNQVHTLDCTAPCTVTEGILTLHGNVTGSIALFDDPSACCLQNRVHVTSFNSSKPRGHVDDLTLDPSTTTLFGLADMDPLQPGFIDATNITVHGRLLLDRTSESLGGTRQLTLGEQFPIVVATNPIVGAFDSVESGTLPNNLTFDLVTTPTTITAVVVERPEIEFSVAAASVTEGTLGGRILTATATTSRPFGHPVDASVFVAAGGTASFGSDFSLNPKLHFAAGSTVATTDIGIVTDASNEADETFTLRFGTSPSFADADADTLAVTIVDDDGPDPVLTVTDVSITEGTAFAKTATVMITRSGSLVSPASVTFATANNTATAPGDYTALNQAVTFAAGEATKAVGVTIGGDGVPEPDETVTVRLSDPVGASIGTGSATITIVNDDGSPPTLSINDVTVVEGTGGTKSAAVTVVRSGSTIGTLSVKVATANGSATAATDFTNVTTMVNLPAFTTTATVFIPITTDAAPEPDEQFVVNLSNQLGALLADATAVVTITDDD